jgi:hypothetical protein
MKSRNLTYTEIRTVLGTIQFLVFSEKWIMSENRIVKLEKKDGKFLRFVLGKNLNIW